MSKADSTLPLASVRSADFYTQLIFLRLLSFKTLSIKWHKINDKLQVKATEKQTNKSIIIKEDLLCGEHTLNPFIGLRDSRTKSKKIISRALTLIYKANIGPWIRFVCARSKEVSLISSKLLSFDTENTKHNIWCLPEALILRKIHH